MCYTKQSKHAKRKEGHMVTEARRRTKAKYDAKTVQYIFRLRLEGDADIIAKLRSMPNKTEYLRRLVRADIEKES